MARASRYTSVLILLFFSISCHRTEGPSDTGRNISPVVAAISDAPDPSKLGVFASTSDGIKELVVYGEQTGTRTFRLPDVTNAPAVAEVKAFYLNMPDTKVMNSKIFWLPTSQESLDEESSTALPIQMESVKANMYKALSPGLDAKKGGLLLFKVGMPLGTPDRLYAIKLSGTQPTPEEAQRAITDICAIAAAWDAYATASNTYYPKTHNTDGPILFDELAGALSPVYIRQMPQSDPWGRPYQFLIFNVGRGFQIRSLGAGGKMNTAESGDSAPPDSNLVLTQEPTGALKWLVRPAGTKGVCEYDPTKR